MELTARAPPTIANKMPTMLNIKRRLDVELWPNANAVFLIQDAEKTRCAAIKAKNVKPMIS